jgi:hypothetical protein
MPLNVQSIVPLRGTMHCLLFENLTIDLPLNLYYTIEIPFQAFDSGHTYAEQPVNTSLIVEWITFPDLATGKQESDWKNLLGKEYALSHEEGTAEASVYLGTEHCWATVPRIRFTHLKGITFEVELDVAVEFNIDTVNLAADGLIHLKTQVDYQGLILYDKQFLPTFDSVKEPLSIIGQFIDISGYEGNLVRYENPHVDWQQLKAKPE